ncbi:hypothetical protein BJ912DRAFT_951241 [Pholiota molesta]|nr:hypothetical protein BJ912DRAFT_951241 [Pholiota molesta]
MWLLLSNGAGGIRGTTTAAATTPTPETSMRAASVSQNRYAGGATAPEQHPHTRAPGTRGEGGAVWLQRLRAATPIALLAAAARLRPRTHIPSRRCHARRPPRRCICGNGNDAIDVDGSSAERDADAVAPGRGERAQARVRAAGPALAHAVDALARLPQMGSRTPRPPRN